MSEIVFWLIVVFMLVVCFSAVLFLFPMALGAGLGAAIGSNQERNK